MGATLSRYVLPVFVFPAIGIIAKLEGKHGVDVVCPCLHQFAALI